MEPPGNQTEPIKQHLGLWDAVSIIVGIVIGAGIYETAPFILTQVSSAQMGLGVWVIGGALSLIGALCYAELATTYPQSGGDYVYLTRAFGPWVGFLFGWAQLAVIRTGNIGMMAYIFGEYAVGVWDFGAHAALVYAVGAVAALTGLNVLGVIFGKGTQNLLTAAKIIGLAGIVVAGFFFPRAAEAAPTAAGIEAGSFGLAMVLVLYTYGGWNDSALVAAELRNGKRNIPLALILGTLIITVIYLLINGAYLQAVGFEGARHAQRIAAVVLGNAFGENGKRAMAVLVMISALGAINGMTFTGSRVYATMGSDHPVFAWLGRWHPGLGTPLWSLLAQFMITLALIVLVGSETGVRLINWILNALHYDPVEWHDRAGFQRLLDCTAPAFWLFFLLTGISLFILRVKDRHLERPFTVPWYPVLPIIFCATSAYMLYSATVYARQLALVPGVLIFAGLLLYLPFRNRVPSRERESQA